jgi:hypothetical protein
MPVDWVTDVRVMRRATRDLIDDGHRIPVVAERVLAEDDHHDLAIVVAAEAQQLACLELVDGVPIEAVRGPHHRLYRCQLSGAPMDARFTLERPSKRMTKHEWVALSPPNVDLIGRAMAWIWHRLWESMHMSW